MTNPSAAIVAFLFLTVCAVVSGQALPPRLSSANSPSESMGPAAMGPSSAYPPSEAMGPLPSDDCMTKVFNMSDCLSYVLVRSNVTKPDEACCPELAGLVENNPICLCKLLGKSNDYGLNIDLNRALKLPSICGVQTPSVDLCSVVGVPVGGPVGGPTASEEPGLAAGPSTSNNDRGASTSNNDSGASSSNNAVAALVLTILVGFAFGYFI